MIADRLREAARVLRDRAERSVPSPWTLDARNDGRAWVRMARDQQDDITAHGYPSTAAYIATMHPGVGLALAALMEHVATDEGDGLGCADTNVLAFDLADLILEGAA